MQRGSQWRQALRTQRSSPAKALIAQTSFIPFELSFIYGGAVAPTLSPAELQRVNVPVLVFNGKSDAANQKVGGILKAIPTASAAECEGDHDSTPYQPTFQQAVVRFFEEQWRSQRVTVS